MKKQTNLRIRIYVIIISLMAILIMGILLLAFFNAQSTAEHRSESDGQFSVSQLKYNCDDIFRQIWRITNLAYIDNHAQAFMSNSIGSDSRDNLVELESLCSSYHFTHSMIFEIGFYSRASRQVYALNNALTSSYFGKDTETDPIYANLFTFIDSTDSNKSVFYYEKRNSYTPYLLTLIRANATKNGATFLSIDLSALLDNMPTDTHTEFYIVSGDGTLLCSTQNKDIGKQVTQLDQFSQWDPTKSTQYRNVDNQKLLYSTTKSELLDLYYIAIQSPSSSLFLSAHLPFIGISVILTLAVAVLLIVIIPKNISHSLSTITNLLDSDHSKTDSKNDMNLNLIAEQIISLLGHNADLQSSVGSKMEELRLLNTKALQYQINPHFIYNTLNLVNTISVRDFGNDHDIAIIMRKLAKILRYTLDTSSDLVSVNKELEHTQYYVDIMQMCYPDLFNITYSIPDNLLDCEIPRLSFQPLIENAIYHGILPKGGGTITLSVDQSENNLKVCICDDGVGMTAEQVTRLNNELSHADIRANHIGLANIHRRIQLLFGESYGLSLHSEQKFGVCVAALLPFAKKHTDKTEPPRLQ